MAFKDNLQNREVQDYLDSDFFYNLGSSVGYGCPNRPDDVKLVQYFLNVSNGYYDWIFGKSLVVDGDFGGQTWAAIKKYQLRIGFNGYGLVSSVKGINYTSPKSKIFYTIVYLNHEYRNTFPQFWTKPGLDPGMPSELKAKFSSPLPQLA